MVPATFHPVFLVLVWCQMGAAHVEPPTDVTLHCHNLHNVVKWRYGQLLPGLKFRVDVGGLSSRQNLTVDPPALEAEFSSLSDPTDVYLLTVTAVIGQNESESAPPRGTVFSYLVNIAYREGIQKCFLDIPSMNVTTHPDGIVLFQFTHPWFLNPRKLPSSLNGKPRKKKSHDPIPKFKYNVLIINQTKPPEGLTCEEKVCEGKLAVDPAQEKHCVKVTGEMEYLSVRSTKVFCSGPVAVEQTELKNYASIYIPMVVILALSALAFVIFMVYKKKTKPSGSFPTSTAFDGGPQTGTLAVPQEDVFVPVVEAASPTPLLSTKEMEGGDLGPAGTFFTEPELRLPIGQPAEEKGAYDFGKVTADEEDGYRYGRSFEEDEPESFSGGYEKRSVLVQLAPDEQAQGYRGGAEH